MANIKSLSQSSDKWKRRAAVAGPDYLAGVQNPKRSWSDAAASAEGNYKQGVTAAATQGRFSRGVKRAGDQAWKAGASNKGPARFAEGVGLAVDDWQRGFAPYQSAIEAIKLPDRAPAGDPRNIQRVVAVATALRALKEKGA